MSLAIDDTISWVVGKPAPARNDRCGRPDSVSRRSSQIGYGSFTHCGVGVVPVGGEVLDRYASRRSRSTHRQLKNAQRQVPRAADLALGPGDVVRVGELEASGSA